MSLVPIRNQKAIGLIGLALLLATVVATAHAATSGPVVVTVEYHIIGGAKGSGAPVFSYYLGGVLNSTVLVNQTQALLIDSGSRWTISGQLPGSNSTYRWATPVSTGTARTGLVNVTYYLQLSVSLLVTTMDGGKATPVVNFTQYGTPLLDRPSGQTVWIDNGTQYSYSAVVGTSRPGERYIGVGTLSGNATGPGAVTVTYFHQRLLTANYSLSGGSGMKPPVLTGVAEGSAESTVLSTNSSQVWLDSGLPYNATQQVNVSPNERWSSETAAGTVSSDLNITFRYYLQYTLQSSFTVVGGQSPSQPVLNFTFYGTHERIATQESPVTVWADAGSSFAMNALLQGSSASERWVSNQTTSGTLDSPAELSPAYYHQYLVQIGYSLRGKGAPASPVLTYVSMGTENTVTPSYLPLWADGESRVLLTQTLQGSSQGTRWELGGQVPQVLSAPITENFTYYLQVAAQISVDVTGGGSFPGSVGFFTSLGNTVSIPLNSTTYWLDRGSTWGFQANVTGRTGEMWVLVGTHPTGTATAPLSLTLTYQHEFEVVTSLGPYGGGHVTTSPSNSTQWVPYDQQVSLSAINDSGWEFGYWLGNQNLTSSSVALKIEGFVNETAVFYPEVTVISQSGGTVRVVGDNSSGTASPSKPFVGYETPGSALTVYATPSNSISQFDSWAGTSTGTRNPLTIAVNGPSQVSAAFSTSTLNLLILVGGVALVSVGVLIAFLEFRKGRKPSLKGILRLVGLGGK